MQFTDGLFVKYGITTLLLDYSIASNPTMKNMVKMQLPHRKFLKATPKTLKDQRGVVKC
jgi:hypothetical protein